MSIAIESTSAPSTTARLAGKYLTFKLGNESYGLPVLRVREIVRQSRITRLPQLPPHVCGVINLRGRLVPVIDLRTRFDMDRAEATDRTCIIVVQVLQGANLMTNFGLVVDDVEEVAPVNAADLEETPDFGVRIDTQFVLGMAKIKGAVKALLDIDKVICTDIATSLPAEASATC